MRITAGKVVGGQIIVEGEPLQEGSVVTILVSDERTFTLNEADEAALLESIAEADRDELIAVEDLFEEAP
jgi:class 3 adenylate cyclase